MKPFIHIRDDLAPLDLHEAVWEACRAKNWTFGHGSNDSTKAQFWKLDLDNDPATIKLWSLAQPLCEAYVGRSLRVLRQYANGHTYGLGGELHTDDPREGAYTLLYYPALEWMRDWEGETYFQNRDGDVIRVVRPKPNRSIFFDARIPHVGRAPSRTCSTLRVTIAFKLLAA